MRTERVTFPATPDHEAALDSFAADGGKSVGHVLREASRRDIAEPSPLDDRHEEAPDLLLPELETALVTCNRRPDAMHASLDRALRGDPA